MGLRSITADDAIARLAGFDAVIDARSESEFAEDHLPGAVNWPSLNDAERHAVGTEYKQVSAFDARKRGAALVARNIAGHIERHVAGLPQSWKPLVYCWRGGQRSGALSTVLGQIGFTVHVLEGGYREFRRAVLRDLQLLPAGLQFRVLCGRTGSAKSRLLQALAAAGGQVLDLEALACHRGSVLGPLPGQPQPSQKAFETAVWQALRALQPGRPVFVESESRTIGRMRVPETLLERLRAAPCIQVQMPLAARVHFLLDDYAHFVNDVQSFCQRLLSLRELRGAAVVERWQVQARAGELPAVVEELLTLHYDPVYTKSMQRNFASFGAAPLLDLPDASPATLAAAAQALLGAAPQHPTA
jgi:tRNA 2-selenouridine synthase